MNILGISCYYHDAAAVLLMGGDLVAAAEEERFTRIKHDFSYPSNAINFCLNYAQIKSSDLDYVVFYEKPFHKFERILMSTFATYPKSYVSFRESMITWLTDKLWMKNLISKNIGIDDKKILFIDHHMSHAASSYYPSPFQKSAILTVDGVGEWTTATLGAGEGNKIKILKEMKFPNSLGLLYSAFTAFLGFKVNGGEGKVMGMAPYGEPRYIDKVEKVVRVFDDGSIDLNQDYFSYIYSTKATYTRRFTNLFGEPRTPETNFYVNAMDWPESFGSKPGNRDLASLNKKNQYYADIAASIQEITNRILVKMAKKLKRDTGLNKLCYAGGVALNSVSNWHIFKEAGFEDIFIQPAAGDSGGALGAALYANHQLLGFGRKFVMNHAYWGQEYSEGRVRSLLESKGAKYTKMDLDSLTDVASEALIKKKVIGWFQGRFEWGPRALGNRSILCDPRDAKMKDLVNMRVKFREPFRPFAPVIPQEDVSKYFDLPYSYADPAKYMLYVVPLKTDKAPAVTHIDGTGRLQTITREVNPRYHGVVKAFGEKTGLPILMNTSFNLRGEPIVNTPKEALNTFMNSGMDLLFIDNYVVFKK